MRIVLKHGLVARIKRVIFLNKTKTTTQEKFLPAGKIGNASDPLRPVQYLKLQRGHF